MEYYYEKLKPMLSEYDIEFFSVEVNDIKVTTSAHVHSAFEMLYIFDGSFKIHVDGEQVEVKAGDIVLFPSGAVHSVYHIEAGFGQYYVIKLTPDILFQVFKGGDNQMCTIPFTRKKNGDRFVFFEHEISAEIKQTLTCMINELEKKDTAMYSIQKAFAFQLLILLYRDFYNQEDNQCNSPKIDEKIRALIYKSVAYINENYASDITPDICAKMVNLSCSYYSKLFRIIIGKGFKEYLISIRLAKAYNALVSTDLSITDIAMSYGYKSTAYFISEFKKTYYATPKETRKKLFKKFD